MNTKTNLLRFFALGIALIAMLSGGIGAQPQSEGRAPEPQPEHHWLNGVPFLTPDYEASRLARIGKYNPAADQRVSYLPANYVPQTEPKIARDGRSAREIFGAPRATFVVDYLGDDSLSADVSPGDGVCADSFGDCGLRTAIMETNALPGFDSIEVPAGTLGIDFSGSDEDGAVSGDLDITDHVEIVGAGAATTLINGADLDDRLFHIFNGAVVDFVDLAIGNGNTSTNAGSQLGGAIWVHCSADLLILRVNIGANTSGTFGGAISVGSCSGETSLLYVRDSAIYSNVAASGGGGIDIFDNADVNISNLTVSENLANSAAGGIYAGGGGASQVVDINHSTIADNDVTTDSLQGGGIRAAAGTTVTLSDSIVAYNTVNGSPNNCGGVITSGGDNIYTFAGECPVTGEDIVGTEILAFITLNPPGEVVTQAIFTSSLAWEKDDDMSICPEFDARGVERPQVVNCDSGAYELLEEDVTPTPTSTDGPTATPTDGPTPTATEFAGTELIQNGGFENLGSDGKPDVTPWIVKNSSGDKAKCNKDKDGDGIPDKIVANTGECAFQFKNVVGEAGKLQQTISLGSITPTVGDTLILSLAGQTKGGALGKVKLVVKYGDDTKTKLSLDITNPDAYLGISTSGSLTNTTIVKFKLGIKSSSTAGKVFVDDVSLLHQAASSLIAVPPAELRSSN